MVAVVAIKAPLLLEPKLGLVSMLIIELASFAVQLNPVVCTFLRSDLLSSSGCLHLQFPRTTTPSFLVGLLVATKV